MGTSVGRRSASSLPRAVVQTHSQEAEILVAGPLAEQGAKRGVAVEPREAGPDDLSQRIDERADRPVADQGQVQGRHGVSSASLPFARSSHARTARTSGKRHRATVRPGPTFTEWPCRRLTGAKPDSSVTSSPTHKGVPPRKGSSCLY